MDELSLDFISHCLMINPDYRSSASDLLSHPLFDTAFKDDLALKLNDWTTKTHSE
jgi:serine/threonine protein kinase